MYDERYEQQKDDRRAAYEFHRESAINTLAKKLQIESNIDEIATCIAFAYRNDQADAIVLAQRLNLSQADMCALDDDEDAYWEAIADEGL